MKGIPSLLYWCSRRAKDSAFSLFTQANKWMREKEASKKWVKRSLKVVRIC